jgi:arabinofuranosyltransferase
MSEKHARRVIKFVIPTLLIGISSIVIFNFVAHANSAGLPTDDGYISFSYAQSLADHGTLTLVAGADYVQGYSNFLWVVILAIVHLAGLSIPTAARLLATCSIVALVPTTYILARRLQPDGSRLIAGAVAAITGVLPGGIFFALSGLETSFATLILALVLADLLRLDLEDRPPFIAVVGSVAFCLLRPEGLLIWLVVTVARFGSLHPVRLRGSRHLLGIWFAGFLVPMAAYEAFELFYYGSLLPNTVIAKMGSPTTEIISSAAHYAVLFLAPFTAFVFLAAFGLKKDRNTILLLSAVASFGILAIASAVQDGYPYQRYLFMAVPAIMAMACSGANTILVKSKSSWPRYTRLAPAAVVVVLAFGLQQEFSASPLVSFSQLTSFSNTGASWRAMFAADVGPHKTPYPGYHEVSRWLLRHAHPDQTVALEEIGIVSYYSGLRILDTFGLANKTIGRFPGRPAYKADLKYVFHQRPDYFVIPLAPGLGSLVPSLPGDAKYARSPTFAFGYDLVGVFPPQQEFDAIFARQPGLIAVTSLDRALIRPQLFRAPPALGQIADTPVPNTESLTAARYWLRSKVVGVRGLPTAFGSSGQIHARVPATGRSTFVVGTGPVVQAMNGTWTVRVSGSGGQQESVSNTRSIGSDWKPMDLSLPLSRWRGQRIDISLSYMGSSNNSSLTKPIYVEPRIVTTLR